MLTRMSVSQPDANEDTEIRALSANAVSMAALRVGLAHLVHEIKNPLQLVFGAATLMEKDMLTAKGCGDPSQAEVFRALKSGIEQLRSLASSIQSELEYLWQINPSVQETNLNSLIDEILESEAMRREASKFRVAKHVADNLPPIAANKTLLKCGLLNLCKNATEAMPDGGDLRVTADTCDCSVHLEISDTGGGIAPDLDAFQPFATSKPGGMGLGLAITRHIVESNGGKITYRSEPGNGTTFCLSFPRKAGTLNMGCCSRAG